ncbi:TPM domain-containing protein [Uliginosibacterium sp. H1]|uniref:TPM domain-containing protein n=1 Tax=Uliginosibacterium sp. H1 TaxID=3114757 RepID=UPI002E194CDE|nr:TPM domain-containing protein [Uliginosibacterium sp. H1]
MSIWRGLRVAVFAAFGLLPGLLALTQGQARAQDLAAIPPLSARVTDTSGTLKPDERNDLEARLAAIEQQGGSQVAVLLVPTTQPEDIAAYGIRVADAWKVGRKNVDDGVILIVATQDRKLRLEVGRGLEGAIPDAIAKRIIAETIAPHFQRGDFHAGIAAGIERIAARIGGEALPPPDRRAQGGQAGLSMSLSALFFIIVVIVLALRGARRRSYYASQGGGFGKGVATGVLLDVLSQTARHRGGGGGFGGGGGWGGGGGGFGGGGASGGW